MPYYSLCSPPNMYLCVFASLISVLILLIDRRVIVFTLTEYRDTALESICMSTSHRACTDQSGHSLYSSVASTYSACVLPDPDEVVTMFEEDVYEPLLYTNPGETDIYGIRVHRFKLNTGEERF